MSKQAYTAFGFTNVHDAARATVQAERAAQTGIKATCALVVVTGATPVVEDFDGKSDAASRVSNCASIAKLMDGASASERLAVAEALCKLDGVTFHDCMAFVQNVRLVDPTAKWKETQRNDSPRIESNIAKVTKAKVEKAAAVIAEKVAGRKSSRKDKAKAEAQPQAKPNKEAEVPAEVLQTDKMRFMAALAEAEKIAASCKWDCPMSEKARAGIAKQFDLLREVGSHIKA